MKDKFNLGLFCFFAALVLFLGAGRLAFCDETPQTASPPSLASIVAMVRNNPHAEKGYIHLIDYFARTGNAEGIVQTMNTAEDNGIRSMKLYQHAGERAFILGFPDYSLHYLQKMDQLWKERYARRS